MPPRLRSSSFPAETVGVDYLVQCITLLSRFSMVHYWMPAVAELRMGGVRAAAGSVLAEVQQRVEEFDLRLNKDMRAVDFLVDQLLLAQCTCTISCCFTGVFVYMC